MLFNTALFTSLLALSPAPTAAISQITRTGKYLYNDGGERFYIKGVAYQPQGEVGPSSEANDAKYVHAGHLVNSLNHVAAKAIELIVGHGYELSSGGFPEPSSYIDPLSSATNCTRDLPYLQQLGANAIRVYSVNPDNDHSECMKTFSDAGIYVL
jgi:hypothetical protein